MTMNIGKKSVPTPIAISFWLWVVVAVLLVISGILTATSPAEQAAATRLNLPVPTEVMTISSGIGSFIGAALHVLFAWFMAQGRNWARVILTIFGVLSVLGSIASIFVGNILAIIVVIVTIVAVVEMYLPAARAHFSRTVR
jgi:low temperature requirement protein LtrA